MSPMATMSSAPPLLVRMRRPHLARVAPGAEFSRARPVLTARNFSCYVGVCLHSAYIRSVSRRSKAFRAVFYSVFMMPNLPIENPLFIKPEGLSQRQENFARHYLENGSAVDAYVHAYNVATTTNRNSLRSTAFNVLNHPKVRARVAALQAATNERAVTSTADLIADLEAMATADVSEIMAVTVGACRYCHGEGHHYQWRSEEEFARRFDAAMKAREPLPTLDGGVGYRSDREPHPECFHCDGAGVQRVHLSSTNALSPAARKLLKSVELFPDGSLKRLHLHDQFAIRMELHRVKGMLIERSINVNATMKVPALKDMSQADVLDYLESLKPTRAPINVECANVDDTAVDIATVDNTTDDTI